MQRARAAGESVLAREYQRVVTRAFSTLSQSQDDPGLEAVRRIVSDSWQRSLSALPPTGRDTAEQSIDADELRQLRKEGPLARALPIVRRLLIEPARDTGLVVAIGDAQGRLLHNFGPLNCVGGERRLNVAVTRAKCNVQLVSSMH